MEYYKARLNYVLPPRDLSQLNRKTDTKDRTENGPPSRWHPKESCVAIPVSHKVDFNQKNLMRSKMDVI